MAKQPCINLSAYVHEPVIVCDAAASHEVHHHDTTPAHDVQHASTPLHVACEHDSDKVVRILLENGCDLRLQNNVGD